MKHFGIPVLAFDCVFNRFTTEDRALFFRNSDDLCEGVVELTRAVEDWSGEEIKRIARRRYTWDIVGREYLRLIGEIAAT